MQALCAIRVSCAGSPSGPDLNHRSTQDLSVFRTSGRFAFSFLIERCTTHAITNVVNNMELTFVDNLFSSAMLATF
jgi:hypothetical protein